MHNQFTNYFNITFLPSCGVDNVSLVSVCLSACLSVSFDLT